MTAQPLTPELALTTLLSILTEKCAHLRTEAQSIEEQWGALRHAGGQRSDHAAQLLATLRQRLTSIIQFCQISDSQIAAILADPISDAPPVADGPVPPPPLPRNLRCPTCACERFNHLEDIACARRVREFEDGMLLIDGHIQGYADDGTNPRIQCANCCAQFAVPDDHDFVG